MKCKKLKSGELAFKCPGCKDYHVINVDPKIKGPCWEFNGDYENPTFKPSIRSTMRDFDGTVIETCHSFVTDGKIKFLSDCSHNSKNKTLDLIDIGVFDV